jgi:hypothetical protein
VYNLVAAIWVMLANVHSIKRVSNRTTFYSFSEGPSSRILLFFLRNRNAGQTRRANSLPE